MIVVPRKGAQVATRFNTSGQNNVGDDRKWIINESRLVDRRGEIMICDAWDDSQKYDVISDQIGEHI